MALRDGLRDLFELVCKIRQVLLIQNLASSAIESVWGIFRVFIGFSIG